MRYGIWAALFAIVCAVETPAAQPAPSRSAERAVVEYVRRKHGRVSYHAVRLADGKILASRDARTPMIPASVQKLCTAAAGLEVLGGDFQFTTTLAVLGDDLVVVGDGDPLLGDPVAAARAGRTIYATFDRWAAALTERGIVRIKGDLVLDEGIFDAGRHADWQRRDRQRRCGAPASGLNFHDNCLNVRLTRTGAAVTAEVSPACRAIRVVNRVRAGGKHLLRLTLADGETTATLTGTAAKSMTDPLPVAVDSPALLLGRVLADRLTRAGVAVAGTIRPGKVADAQGRLPDGAVVVARHQTPLPAVLAAMGKRSLNLAAECLALRAAVATADKRPATFADAAQLTTRILNDRYGLDIEQFTIADGSGLSRRNRLSAAVAVQLLTVLIRGENAQTFGDSLAFGGLDGALRKRLKDLPGRILAKTGHLTGVLTVAGYILDADGRPVAAFAILCNDIAKGNWRANNIQDTLLRAWARRLDTDVSIRLSAPARGR